MNTRSSLQESHSTGQISISSSAESDIDEFLSEEMNIRVARLAEEHTFALLGSMAVGTAVSGYSHSDEDVESVTFHETLSEDVKKSVPNIERISQRLSISRWILFLSIVGFALPVSMIAFGMVSSENDQYVVGLLFLFLLISVSITGLTMLNLSLVKEHYYRSVANAALVKCANSTLIDNSVSLDIDLVIEDVQRVIVSHTANTGINVREILSISVLDRLRSIRERTC